MKNSGRGVRQTVDILCRRRRHPEHFRPCAYDLSREPSWVIDNIDNDRPLFGKTILFYYFSGRSTNTDTQFLKTEIPTTLMKRKKTSSQMAENRKPHDSRS